MKTFKIELRWAILFSILLMVWMFIEQQSGLHDQHISQQFLYHLGAMAILYVFVYYKNMAHKRKYYYKGDMDWQHGLVSGIVLSVLITILSPMTVYFVYHYISPEFFHNMIDYEISKGEKLDQIKMFYSMKGFIIDAVSMRISFGFLFSVVMPLFFRKKIKVEEE